MEDIELEIEMIKRKRKIEKEYMEEYTAGLSNIEEELRTPEVCMDAIRKNGNALSIVPKEIITIEMCMEAVRNKGEALAYVPDNLRTTEICMEAVKNDGEALQYVPIITKELCDEAVKNTGKSLKYVPKELRTEELCMKAIKDEGYVLCYTPNNIKTQEMCEEAVKRNGSALKYVPNIFKTPEMCMQAVKDQASAIQWVPIKCRTPEICMEAVKQYGDYLRYAPFSIPFGKGNTGIYMSNDTIGNLDFDEFIKQRDIALENVTDEIKLEIYKEAVKRHGDALRLVHQEFRTIEMCMDAVKNNGKSLRYVPKILRTEEMCIEAVKNNKEAIKSVPANMRNMIALEVEKQIMEETKNIKDDKVEEFEINVEENNEKRQEYDLKMEELGTSLPTMSNEEIENEYEKLLDERIQYLKAQDDGSEIDRNAWELNRDLIELVEGFAESSPELQERLMEEKQIASKDYYGDDKEEDVEFEDYTPEEIDALLEKEIKSKEARDAGFEINEYGEIIRPAKQPTNEELENMTEEELQEMIETNDKTIEHNNKTLKKSLVERILDQQKIISEQQQEIMKLNSQKKEL